MRRGVVVSALVFLVAALAAGCAQRRMVLELHATVLYDKPKIERVSYVVTDSRREGGTVVVNVELLGDPGLSASFDISPDVVISRPMRETGDGNYEGEFAFPPETLGGPFTVIGRLRHEQAGEVVIRDPEPFAISLFR